VLACVAHRYLPTFHAKWLRLKQAGIRPKLARPGRSFRDFVIDEDSARRFPAS
jgi:hypothetical protein